MIREFIRRVEQKCFLSLTKVTRCADAIFISIYGQLLGSKETPQDHPRGARGVSEILVTVTRLFPCCTIFVFLFVCIRFVISFIVLFSCVLQQHVEASVIKDIPAHSPPPSPPSLPPLSLSLSLSLSLKTQQNRNRKYE